MYFTHPFKHWVSVRNTCFLACIIETSCEWMEFKLQMSLKYYGNKSFLYKSLRIFRMVWQMVLCHDPCSSLGATTMWILAFWTILFHSSLSIAILLQFRIFISPRSAATSSPTLRLCIPILAAIMIHVGEVFIVRSFEIPPGVSCGLHSRDITRCYVQEELRPQVCQSSLF